MPRRPTSFAAVEAIGRALPDVRLTRIRLDALRDLVIGARRFVSVKMRSWLALRFELEAELFLEHGEDKRCIW